MAARQMISHPLVVRSVRVKRVQDVSARLRRITLAGDQLGAFSRDGLDLTAFTAPGFDDHIKLIFNPDGPIDEVLPVQLAHGIEWTPAPQRVSRDYTPRRIDLEAGELDLEFVMHGDGPAARWARTATPGTELWFVGPKASTVLPDDIDWLLLAGDETALPAIARFLDERPVERPAQLVLAGPADSRIPLPVREGDTVRWVTEPEQLPDAVRELEWWPGEVYAWAAGESRALLPLRRHLRHERDVPRTHIDVTGYWHRTEAEGEPEPVGPASPLAWFATRAGLQLGLLQELAAGPRATDDLAVRAEVPPTALVPLLQVLAEADVVGSDDGGWRIGPVGAQLLDDDHLVDELVGHEADQLLSLAGLAGALQAGATPWQAARGKSLWQEANEDPERFAELIEHAGQLRYLTTGITALELWADLAPGSRVGLSGAAAGIVGEALPDGPAITVVAGEQVIPVQQESLDRPQPQWQWQPNWTDCDVAVIAYGLCHRTDAEAEELLRELGQVSGRVVVIESTDHDALSPDGAEDALLGLATIGVPPRTVADVTERATQAGWRLVDSRALGWGVSLAEFGRS